MLDTTQPVAPPALAAQPATPAATLYRGPDGVLRYRSEAEIADQRIRQSEKR